MEKRPNTTTSNNFDELIEVLSNTIAGLINGTMESANAWNIVNATRTQISAVKTQLNYVKIMGRKPEGNFSELFKSKNEAPHTTDGNGNGNGRRRTARPIIN